MITTASSSIQRRIWCVATLVATLMLAVFVATGTAQAGTMEGHLPGKTWTTPGVFTNLSWVSGFDPERLTICTTAAEFSGSWSFPYGWECGGEWTVWTHSPGVNGYPAVDNPNSREIHFSGEYF